MKIPQPWPLALYAYALHLFPTAFRIRYRDEMLAAAAEWHAESHNDLLFAAILLNDTLKAAIREHWRAASPAKPGYAALFAIFFSFLLLSISVFNQQVLRRGADRQPMELVAGVAQRVALGADPTPLSAGPPQEIASEEWLHGTQPFTVLYNAAGKAIAGNATLHGSLPQPPPGIFSRIRARGYHQVTWQPQPGIRVALTGRALPEGGFVLAGQSLIPGEAQEARFHNGMLLMWFLLLIALACILAAGEVRRHSTKPMA